MSESKLSAFDEYYSQRDTKDRTIKTLVLKKVRESYVNMMNSMYVLLITARKNPKYGTVTSYKQLMRDANDIVDIFVSGFERNLFKKCVLLANYSIRSEIKDVSKFVAHPKADHKGYADSVEIYLKEQMVYVKAQSDRIIGQLWSVVRTDNIKIQRLMKANNMSRKDATKYQVANSDFDLKFNFVDKANRKKDAGWYFEMLASSMMKNIELDSYIYAMITDGLDLASINKCVGDHKCSKHDGTIISITGKYTEYKSFDEIQNEGYIWHPNCSHLITAIEEKNESY